jgi:hypothetical protein
MEITLAKLEKAQLLEMDLPMEYQRPLEYLYVLLRVHTSLISKAKRYTLADSGLFLDL